MEEYNFDTGYSYFDRESFKVFSEHFEIKNLTDEFGTNVFKWDGWTKIENLPVKELCKLSTYMFCFDKYAFTDESSKKDFSLDKLFNIMKEKRITKDIFLDHMWDFEIEVLGPETAAIMSNISRNLDGIINTRPIHIRDMFYEGRQRFEDNNEKIKKYNNKKEAPFTLDQIISFENEPVCLRYDDTGKLYVLDSEAILHNIDNGIKYHLDLGLFDKLPNINEMRIDLPFQIFPSIAISEDILFVVNARKIYKFNVKDQNLSEKIPFEYEIYTGEKRKWKTPDPIGQSLIKAMSGTKKNAIINHDILLKEGNLLISTSNEEGTTRSIIQGDISGHNFKKIYTGSFPLGYSREWHADHTLRLDVHKGNLYFPHNTGISLYRQENIEEMLDKYVRKITITDSVRPITKFSIGDNFMVAQANLKDVDPAMLCIFRPKYDVKDSELVPINASIQPSHFEMEYVSYLPFLTGITMANTSISAHKNKFAITNTVLKKVLIYKMKETQ